MSYCFKYSCCNEYLFINGYICWLLQCAMDLTMSLRAFYLFIELLTVKKMSCICHLTPFNA